MINNVIIRIALLIISALLLFKLNSFIGGYDLIIILFLLIGLILNFKKRDTVIDRVSNYLFWILMILMISIFKNFTITGFKDAFVILVLLKFIVLTVCYLKYKKIIVPSSFFNKLWIFTLFLYLSEIMFKIVPSLK